MIPKIAVHDSLSPLARRWSQQLDPSVLRAWQRAAKRALPLAKASASRHLATRTGRGLRGIRARAKRVVSGIAMEIWPSVGYMAAHELGSRIPAWKKRPAFSLPRRPWATDAVPGIERVAVESLEAELQKTFGAP